MKLGGHAVSLFQLYRLATRMAPKSNETPYLHLWLGYARHQGCAREQSSMVPKHLMLNGHASVSQSTSGAHGRAEEHVIYVMLHARNCYQSHPSGAV